jgi:hypothetical protein
MNLFSGGDAGSRFGSLDTELGTFADSGVTIVPRKPLAPAYAPPAPTTTIEGPVAFDMGEQPILLAAPTSTAPVVQRGVIANAPSRGGVGTTTAVPIGSVGPSSDPVLQPAPATATPRPRAGLSETPGTTGTTGTTGTMPSNTASMRDWSAFLALSIGVAGLFGLLAFAVGRRRKGE